MHFLQLRAGGMPTAEHVKRIYTESEDIPCFRHPHFFSAVLFSSCKQAQCLLLPLLGKAHFTYR